MARSVRESRSLYAVDAIGQFGGSEYFCGLRGVGVGEAIEAAYALDIDATTEAALHDAIGSHLNSPNYVANDAALVAVIVGGGHPAILSKVEDGGALRALREIDTTILNIEVAGPDAPRSKATRTYEKLLMYKPRPLAPVQARPWWRFWGRG